jgi:NADPH:quinone reductase-like Zn-dependent oxidoreductase
VHAWLCENPVGVDALTWKELPTPAPGAGEVLIRIEAASLNFPDLLIVQNKYQMKPPLPFVPGSEYAGVIEAVGDGVRGPGGGPAGGLPVGHRRLSAPTRWPRRRCACRCRPVFRPWTLPPSS